MISQTQTRTTYFTIAFVFVVFGMFFANTAHASRASKTSKRQNVSHAAVPIPDVVVRTLNALLTPIPPPLPDTTTNAFKRLIVKNLGPILNSKKDDFAPTVTADGRTMFFVSKREGSLKDGEDFWKTTSPENNDTTWSLPKNESQINSESNDGAASIAADGQTIYMASSRNTTERGDINIWTATLEGSNWKNIREVGAPINTTDWETQPSISPDGKKLFFVSNRPGKIGKDDKSNVDIFVSHQLSDGRWGEPKNLGSKINTPGYDGSPFIAADGTTLYFCTNGHHAKGDVDIFMSEFKGPSDTDWTEPVRLPEPINSEYNDLFLTVPASGSVMYFTSDRPGDAVVGKSSGKLDIWVAFNPPAPKATLVLRGTCYDVNTKEKLAAHVVIVDEQTRDTLYNKDANSSTGEYLCVIPANSKGECGGSFLISATEKDHFPYPPTREIIPMRSDTSRIITHDIPMNNEEPPVVKWVTEDPALLKELPGKYPNYKGVIIREQQTIELFPLLPLVFFDEGKSTFPSRYVLFSSPSQTQGFTDDTITATFNGYWNYMNVLGYRLTKNPTVSVKLVGCNSMDVAAEKSTELSRARAETIKKYLVDIWSIDPKRLPVEARNLPENSTLATTPEGIEENRRVEIKSDDWEIVKPIKRQETKKYADYRTAKFSLKNGLRLQTIQSRELVISHNGQEWARIKDLGELSSTMSPEWNWRSQVASKLPIDETDMSVQLFIKDKTGRVVPSNIDNTHVRQYTTKDVTKDRLKDKTRETYNLILFKYNSFEMGKWNHKILEEFVFDRIQPNSDVQVNGYTDILGTEEYNAKLSQNRADATKKEIAGQKRKAGTLQSKGYGKSAPLYMNDLPEGRYYNRTVQVLVETPTN